MLPVSGKEEKRKRERKKALLCHPQTLLSSEKNKGRWSGFSNLHHLIYPLINPFVSRHRVCKFKSKAIN